MKNRAEKNRLKRTLKIADIGGLRPWGLAPNPTRDQSLDPLAGPCPDPSSPEAGKRAVKSFSPWQG